MAVWKKEYQAFLDDVTEKSKKENDGAAKTAPSAISLDEIIARYGRPMPQQQQQMMQQSDATKRANANVIRNQAQAVMGTDLLNIQDEQLMGMYRQLDANNSSLQSQLTVAGNDPRVAQYSPQLRQAQVTLEQANKTIGRAQGGVSSGWQQVKTAEQLRNEAYQQRLEGLKTPEDYSKLMSDLDDTERKANLYQTGSSVKMHAPSEIFAMLPYMTDEQLQQMYDDAYSNMSTPSKLRDAILGIAPGGKTTIYNKSAGPLDIFGTDDPETITLKAIRQEQEKRAAAGSKGVEDSAQALFDSLTPDQQALYHYKYGYDKSGSDVMRKGQYAADQLMTQEYDRLDEQFGTLWESLPEEVKATAEGEWGSREYTPYDNEREWWAYEYLAQKAEDDIKARLNNTTETPWTDTLSAEDRAIVDQYVNQYHTFSQKGYVGKSATDIYSMQQQEKMEGWNQAAMGQYTGDDPDIKAANDAFVAAEAKLDELNDMLIDMDPAADPEQYAAMEQQIATLANELRGMNENIKALAAGEMTDLNAIKKYLYGDASIWRLIGTSAMEGVANFAQGFYGTIDLLGGRPINAVGNLITGGPKPLLDEKGNPVINPLTGQVTMQKAWTSPITDLSNYYKLYAQGWQQEADNAVQALGGGAVYKAINNTISNLVENIPNTLMSVMSGQMMSAGELATVQNQAIDALRTLGMDRTAAQTVMQSMLKDPQYWLSFMREAGSDYQEAIDDGADPTTAGVYAFVTAFINSGIEIGVEGDSGFEGLGKGGDGGFMGKVLTAVTGHDMTMLAEILSSMGEEGGEEFKQGLVSGLVKKAMYAQNMQYISFDEGTDAVFNLPKTGKEMLYGALAGGFMAGMTEPGANFVNRIATDTQTGAQIIGNDQAQALAGIAEDSAHIHNKTTEAIKNGTLDVNSKAGQRAVGKLWRETYAGLDEASQAALDGLVSQPVQRTLEANGYEGDAAEAAQVVAKEYHGGRLTRHERAIMDDPMVSDIAAKLWEGEFGEEDIQYDESDAMRQNYQFATQEDLGKLAEMPKIGKQDTHSTDQEGPRTELQQVDTSRLGAVGARSEATEEALDEATGMVPDDQNGTETARLFGQTGRSAEDLESTLTDNKIEFNNEEVKKAYEEGREQRKQKAAAELEHIRELNRGGKNGTRTGVVRGISPEEAEKYNVKRMGQKLSKKQYAAVQALRKVAGRMNLNIVLYESQMNEKGQRTGSQGFYDRNSDTVYLDMFAGYGNEQAILRTAAHELTHVIQKWSPEKYNQLQEYLLDAYYKNDKTLIPQLVQDQIQKAEDAGHTLDEPGALDEITADAMEMMLSDADAIRNLAQKDEGLFKKIKNWIDDFVNSIRAAMEGIDPHSREARILADMRTEWEKLQGMWLDALNNAAENRGGDYTEAAVEDFSMDVEGTVVKKQRVSEPDVVTTEQTDEVKQPEPAKPKAKPAAPKAGANTGVAYTNDQTPVQFHYALVPSTDLIASNTLDFGVNEAYPQELQPRDRTRSASRDQVLTIAKDLNPARLGESADIQSGAPIIGSDNVVESGNGRVMALQYAMANIPGSAKRYTDWLRENATKFGLDPNDVQDGSVLVRVRDSDTQRTDFVKAANESVNAAYSETENAESDAEKLTPGMMEMLMPSDNGNLDNIENVGFANRYMEKIIPKNERGNYMQQDGRISQRGWERMRNAIFQRAYGSSSLTQLLSESTDNNVQNILKALLQSAARAVQVQEQVRKGQLFDIGLGQAITNAAKRYAQLKKDGVKLDTYLNQTYMPGFDMETADEIAIMRLMDKYSRAPKQLAGVLKTLYTILAEYGNPDQTNMLGESMKPSLEAVVDQAETRYEKYGDEAANNGLLFSERDAELDKEYAELTKDFEGGADVDNDDWYREHIPEYKAAREEREAYIKKNHEEIAELDANEKEFNSKHLADYLSGRMLYAEYQAGIKTAERERLSREYHAFTKANTAKMLQAVEDYFGKIRKLVDEAASNAGYTQKAYHGSNAFGFTTFDMDISQNQIFVAFNENIAKTYGYDLKKRNIGQKVAFKKMSDKELLDYANKAISPYNSGHFRILTRQQAEEYIKINPNAAEIVTDKLNSTKGGVFMSVDAPWMPIEYLTREDVENKLQNRAVGKGIYTLYTRPGNQLTVDAKDRNWNQIHPEWDKSGKNWKTREVGEYARGNGYDSVRINNVFDHGGGGSSFEDGFGDIGIFFNQDDVKSADLVTYDDEGNIIPLSKRFQPKNPDIRYSDRETTEKELSKEAKQMQFGRHPSMLQFSVRSMNEATGLTMEVDENSVHKYVLYHNGVRIEPGSFTADMVKNTPVGNLIELGQRFATNKKNAEKNAIEQRKFIAQIINMISLYQDAAAVWELTGSLTFSALKTNGDPQYADSYDFGSICAKTQAILNVISETQVRLGRGLTKAEIDGVVYKEVGKGVYRDGKWIHGATPCPPCYVYATWVNKPARLEMIRNFINQYKNWTSEQIDTFMISEAPTGATETETKRLKTDLNQRKLWMKLCLAEQKKNPDGSKYWVRRANPEFCPNEILLDLRRSSDMATKYPGTWNFMQRGGNALGKAIAPYADARVGETIVGKANGADAIGKKLMNDEIGRLNAELNGTEYKPKFINPFLTGNAKQAERLFKKAMLNIKKQNLKGGQRWQSWSDFRAEWGSDYLMEMLTMQLLGSQVQTYTKVVEAVDLLASAGFEVNLSGIPYGDGFWHNEDGSIKIDKNGNMMLRFSPVTGINPDAAMDFVRKYGAKGNVQFMTIGISDEHILAALKSNDVTFVIPFHGSGGSVKRLQHLMNLLSEQMNTGDDYTNAQSDSFAEYEVVGEGKKAKKVNKNPNWAIREAILTGNYDRLNKQQKAFVKENEYLNRLYRERYVDKNAEAYGVFFGKAEAQQIYPYEYWDKNTTLKTADVNSLRFIEYCQMLGVVPRFSGITKKNKDGVEVEYANFSGARRDATGKIVGYDPVPGYWKLLIDRSMYNRIYDDNGNLIPGQCTYHQPQTVSVNNIDVGAMPVSANNTVGYADDDVREITERVMQDIEMESAQNKAAGDALEDVQEDNILNSLRDEEQRVDPNDGVVYSLRTDPAPKTVVYGYKAFYARDGKLYPPMVSNITDEEQQVKRATSGTMKGLPTPVGVWLDADVGGILVDENGVPVRTSTTGRLRVKNAKSGGDASLAFRPGWHLGEWPDAKQFNKADPETGERTRMPNDLVFALCEISADHDYQLDALSYGINEKGGFSRSQAGLPWIPKDGYYKYRTNVDPTTAPWLIAGSIRVVDILDDDDCARICAQFGITPDKRVSGKKINLADYGLKRGPVTADTEGMERFMKNDASRANDELLESALNDPNYANAYVQRPIDFDNKKQYEQLKNEFEMNGQNIEDYRKVYNERGYLGRENGMQYSDRDTNYKTDREILATALESVAANDEERRMLAQYKDMAAALNADEQRIRDLNEQIRLERLENPNSDLEKNLVTERNNLQREVNNADKKLYNLERMAPMRRIAKAERAKAENDLERARQHMLRYREGIMKREYIGRIERTSRRLAKWLTAPAGKSNNYVPESLRRPLGEFLMTIDKISAQRRAGGPMTEEDKKFARQLQQIEQMLRSIERGRSDDVAEEIEEQYGAYVDLPKGFTDTMAQLVSKVQERMESAGTKNILDEMSMSELEALDMTMTAISSSITHINEFLTDAFAGSVSETAKKTIDFMREYRQRKQGMRGLQRAADFVLWDNVMPVYAFDRLGDGGQRVFKALRDGQAKLAFNAKRIIDLAEGLYTSEEAQDWSKEIVEFENPVNGEKIRMTVAHLMSLYALSRREQALGHLLGEGFRVADFKDKKTTVTDRGHVINEVTLRQMFQKLTPRQQQVAESLVNTMSTVGSDWGNYVSMRRFGYRQFTEKNYFPIKSDSDLLPAKTDTSTGNELYKLLNMSMTKPLTVKANNRIMVENIFDVFAGHMADMAQYNAMALPVLDAVKWLNYKASEQEEGETAKYTDGVRDAIRDAYGTAAIKYLTEFLKDVNGGGQVNDTGVDLTQKMLGKYNRVAVAANLRVALLQPLAIIRAANMLPGTSLAKGTIKAVPRLRAEIAEMQEKSGIALWKSLGYREMNIGRSVKQQIQHMETLSDKISDKSMFLAELGDQVTWASMWKATKEYIRKNRRDLVPDTEEFYKAVTDKFEDVIYNTQVVDSILTKSQLMRSSKTTNRMLSSFMSEPTTTFNVLMRAWDKIRLDMLKGKTFSESWKANGLNMGKTALIFLISAAVETVISQLMSAYRDDDDYETFKDKVLAGWEQAFADNANPLTLLPGIKQIYEAGIKPLLGMDTYDDQNVLTEGISTTVKGIQKILNGQGTVWGRAYTLAKGISMTTGIPIHPVMREFQALWNNTAVQLNPSWRLETSTTPQSTGYDLLYKAYAADDEERAKYLTERLNANGYDEKAIQAAMTTRIKKDTASGEISDTEAQKRLQEISGLDKNAAYFKAQQMTDEDGSYSRFDNLEQAIKTGTGYKEAYDELTSHGYPEKDVISKARSIISKMAIDGNMTETEVQKLLNQYGGMTADEAYIRSQELKYQQLTGDSTTADAAMVFYAIDNKTSPKAAIDGLKKHGKDEKSIASSVSSKYKSQYLDLVAKGKTSEAAALKGRLITVFDYLGIDGAKRISDWEKAK